jgi:hypothetical protein
VAVQTDLEYSLDEVEPPDENGYVAFRWEREFFRAILMKYGTVTQAADQAGVTVAMVDQRARESLPFHYQLELCRERMRDAVRHEVIRRAMEPERVPIFSRGKIVGYHDKYDNRLLMWLAERMMPEEFHIPSKIEGANGDGELAFRMELSPGKASDQEQ